MMMPSVDNVVRNGFRRRVSSATRAEASTLDIARQDGPRPAGVPLDVSFGAKWLSKHDGGTMMASVLVDTAIILFMAILTLGLGARTQPR